MNTKFIIGLILVILGLAAYGYFNAVPGNDNITDKPRIEILPKSFDFGQIEYGQIAEYSFKVKNLGNQVLKIRKVATSCGCTTAEISKKEINPGEEVELKIVYDTGVMSGAHARGNQERIIYIKSNDSKTPQVEVIIYAYVK